MLRVPLAGSIRDWPSTSTTKPSASISVPVVTTLNSSVPVVGGGGAVELESPPHAARTAVRIPREIARVCRNTRIVRARSGRGVGRFAPPPIRAIENTPPATLAPPGAFLRRSRNAMEREEIPHQSRPIDAATGASDEPLRQLHAAWPGMAAAANGVEDDRGVVSTS